MNHFRSAHAMAALLLASALTGAADAATFQWDASSGKLPSEVGAFSRVATGIEPRDTLLPGGPLRLHTGDIEE